MTHWAAWSWRFRPDEIKVLSTEGPVAGASLADWPIVRAHTIIGFLADPKYGGNRGYAGWKVAHYPGGGHHLRGFSPGQMIGKDKIKTAGGEEV